MGSSSSVENKSKKKLPPFAKEEVVKTNKNNLYVVYFTTRPSSSIHLKTMDDYRHNRNIYHMYHRVGNKYMYGYTYDNVNTLQANHRIMDEHQNEFVTQSDNYYLEPNYYLPVEHL